MKRKRWLALFVRVEIEARSLGTFRLTDLAKPSWDDISFQFPIPLVVVDAVTNFD